MPIREFPYQNYSLKNIRGEKWKDIPGFEGLYQLSNYGRLKSLDRWVDMGTRDNFRPGRIIKLRKTVSISNGSKLFADLQMKLHKDKKRYYFSVGRFVYYLFVASFNFEYHSYIVTRKDGNAHNLSYKNLQLRSISEVAVEGFVTKKRKSKFQLQIKQVNQYSNEGEFIKMYNSSKQAAEKTDIPAAYINGAARTKNRMAGGYYWRYGKPRRLINLLKFKSSPDRPSINDIDNTNHHYLNRNNKRISGEKWRPIEGYSGLYEISDYGRVRSKSRCKNVSKKNGYSTSFMTKDFIMKQSKKQAYNSYIGETLDYLTVSLKMNGIYNTFLVSRLVYQAFGDNKKKLNPFLVIHNNGDNLDNHISNLRLGTQSEVHKITYQKKRRVSPFSSSHQKNNAKTNDKLHRG